MNAISVKINKASIKARLNKYLAASPAMKKKAYDKVYPFFKRAKATMMRNFNNHPVTRELENGPDSSEGNISNTLNGYEEANLFAYLGFVNGTNPVEPLRETLETETNIKLTQFRSGRYYFSVHVPSEGDIEKATPLPGWSIEKSWAKGIEQGFSNLEYFVWKHWEGGRSHEGFQVPYEYADSAQFMPTPYLSEILEKFRDKMVNLEDTI